MFPSKPSFVPVVLGLALASVLLEGGCHQLVGIEERCTDADCATQVPEGACEKPVCTPQGTCSFVAKTGEACGADGTCRGYACIGSDTTFGAGQSASCLRASDGLVWCWGDGTYGQLGDTQRGPRSTPYLVPRIGTELARARSVSVGYAHACALLETGQVVCWGNNRGAQSNGREPSLSDDPLPPTLIEGLPKAAKVVTGYGHTCVLTEDRRVFCWGRNVDGECGVGDPAQIIPAPREVRGLDPMLSVSTSKLTTCAANAVDVLCWGENKWGQLGPGVTTPIGLAPSKVMGLAPGGVLQVAASWGFVCAIVATSGHLQCWGNNRWGQLGDGKVLSPWGDAGPGESANPQPRFVVAPDGQRPIDSVNTIFYGTGSHVCVRSSIYFPDLLCWGENGAYEVGVPDPTPSPTPLRSPPARGASDLLMGDDHTCALRRETDGFDFMCWGQARAGQVGDGLPIAPHVQPESNRVKWPDAPGGLAFLQANQ
jgi:alpha-tubulin suppressor-like RCC1 family protein